MSNHPSGCCTLIVKRFGCTAIHNKALYKCIIHSFIKTYATKIEQLSMCCVLFVLVVLHLGTLEFDLIVTSQEILTSPSNQKMLETVKSVYICISMSVYIYTYQPETCALYLQNTFNQFMHSYQSNTSICLIN